MAKKSSRKVGKFTIVESDILVLHNGSIVEVLNFEAEDMEMVEIGYLTNDSRGYMFTREMQIKEIIKSTPNSRLLIAMIRGVHVRLNNLSKV